MSLLDKISNIDIEGKNILIIGHPASGKSWLANNIKSNHKIIHTDEYSLHNYEAGLYKLIDVLKDIETPTIVEGVLGYRLLRKGVQLNCYYPDIVIELKALEKDRINIYNKERKNKKQQYLPSFNKGNDNILLDYFKLIGTKKPQWLVLNNTYK